MLFRVCLALALVGYWSVFGEAEEESGAGSDDNVLVLTTSNFADTINSNERVLVEFYAPWCGHCKALAPEYAKAADTLIAEGSSTVLAKVDATEESDLASKYGVRGYPTLKYFTKNVDKPSDYGGGRTADSIVQWLVKREQPAVSILATEEDVKKFAAKNKVALVGYLSEDAQIATLTAFAEANREVVSVGLVSDASGLL